MTVLELNIPLLRKAVEWAEAEAAKPWRSCQWYQGNYSTSPRDLGRDPACGTCYCIAGYVSWQLTGEEHSPGAHTKARNALGLTEDQAYRLFNGSNSIEEVRRVAEEVAGERL